VSKSGLKGRTGYINPGTQGFALGYRPPGLQPGLNRVPGCAL